MLSAPFAFAIHSGPPVVSSGSAVGNTAICWQRYANRTTDIPLWPKP